MTALPRVVARVGIPEAPGRARLHVVPRPDGRDRQADGSDARALATRAPEEGSSPSPSPASEAVAGAAFWFLCGALIAGSLTYESMRVLLEKARQTAERMDANGRYLACEYVRAAQVFVAIPGFERFTAQADVLGEQLAPEVRAACRGAR